MFDYNKYKISKLNKYYFTRNLYNYIKFWQNTWYLRYLYVKNYLKLIVAKMYLR